VLVDAEQLERIESYGNYLFLYTAGGKFIHRETMSAMVKKLDPAEFVRIRRSAIIRIDRIRELHPVDNGEFEVVLESGTVLSSTRRYKKNFESILKS
jgi:two-component system LytT family response regulator